MTNPKITFTSANQIGVGRYRFIVFNDLSIKTNSYTNDHTQLNYSVFPILFNDKYFHLVIDRCAVFEYVKDNFPEYKTEFFVSGYDFTSAQESKLIEENNPNSFFDFIENVYFYSGGVIKNNLFKGNQFFREMYEMYSPESKKIYNLSDINLTLKSCMFFVGADQPLIDLYEKDPQRFIEYMFMDGAKEWLKSVNLEWQWQGLKILKDKMIKKYGRVERNRKIYTSRKLANHFYELAGSDMEKRTRLQENEDIVESYYISQGFEPVTFEDKSFEEQYKIINSCTDIAGYSGSNLLNVIFSYDPINVYEIVNDKRPYDEYKERVMVFGHNHSKVLESRIINGR